MERDAWAEHFRMIGEGTGSVDDRVWANVPSYPPHGCCLGRMSCAALRQMSLGKAGEERGDSGTAF